MSDDELEKLAAEMQNIQPSKTARARGMAAAMAAFDTEFAREAVQASEGAPKNISEKISQKKSKTTQGLETSPRLTEQTTQTITMMERVQSFGRYTMSKTHKIFAFNPKTTMMMGSCAAALVASFIYMESSSFDTELVSPQAVTVTDVNTQGQAYIEVPQIEVQPKTGLPEPKVAAPIAPTPTPDIKTSETKNSQGEPAPVAPNTQVQNIVVTGSRRVRQKPAPSKLREADSFITEALPSRPAPVLNGTLPPAPSLQVTKQQFSSSGFRDEQREVIRERRATPQQNDKFEKTNFNPVTAVKETPVSTFSIDVDTASYSYLRASLNRGELPPPSSIRLEEMINYFPYDYAAPTSADEPFKANVTVTPTPWNADTKLMHIGIKGYVPPVAERPTSNIVLLIDTSGSMRAQNKLPLLINSFKLLLNTLDKDDTVSIVTYAGSAGTVLEPTPADEKYKIKAALDNLRSGGSTAGAAGLELAYNKALDSFDEDGVNRVILATDGDFNVGFSSHEEMKTFIEKKRKTGIFLSVLGFGQGNYNDQLMQSLAQNGNGVAAYIDTLAEANKVLADEAGSALITIAKDVKIQVEFNPATIAEYRLIGYETRALKRQDFNNDAVDAGEIGSGHSVTAIYEMTPVGSPAQTIDDLRYVDGDAKPQASTGSDEFAFVKIRHKLPASDTSTLQTFPIGSGQERSLKRAGQDTRFAAAVAAVGQKLRGDTQLADFRYSDAIKLAKNARGEDDHGYRAEFIQLVRLMETLEDQPHKR